MKRALVSLAACVALPTVPSLAAPSVQDAAGAADSAKPTKVDPDLRPVLSLSLEDALRIALETDLGLAVEENVVDVARYEYAGSWGAFDPVWTATGSLTDSEFEASNVFQSGGSPLVIDENTQAFSTGLSFPLTSGGAFEVAFDTNNNETNSAAQLAAVSTTDVWTLTYRQPLLRGAWKSYATSRQRQAELAWSQAREHRRQVRQEVLLGVQDAYWNLVAALEQQRVADTTLELGRQQLDQNQRRLDAGVGTEVDVLQAQANVAVREQERLRAQVGVKAAADSLKASLFANQFERWDVDIDPVTPLPTDTTYTAVPWQAALAIALEERPEVRQQRLAIQRAELELVRARSERKPTLDLTLSSSARGFDAESSDAFDSASSWEFPTSQAALSFSLPLFNRTAKNAERAARASVIRSHLDADRLELSITTEVRDAVRQVEYQAEAVRAATKSLELARRQLEAEEARYREGLSTTFQVLQFQQQLAEALSSEKSARAEFVKARAALTKAQGLTGVEPRAP
ncbi:MAG: TolC family protein [Planctomycetes bacterium]|nr:TolC family protein [Planctomycetota bacterium]